MMDLHIDEVSCGLVADFFSVFANVTRMKILYALQHGGKSVSEIARDTGVTVQNASQHLHVMREKGAVVAHKQSQHVTYAVADPRFLDVARLVHIALLERLQSSASALSLGVMLEDAVSDD